MNKLLVDNNVGVEEITIDSDMDLTINFTGLGKKLLINIMPNVCLKVFETDRDTSSFITYNIGESCNIVINKLSINCSDNIMINLNKENTKLIFNTSIINYNDNEYKQEINHNCKASESKIVNHCINVEDKEFKFVVDGTVKKESLDTIFKQDNKIINLRDGKSFILPNLIVDNNDIEASHSAYIGTFDEEMMFYMNTRGINKKDAETLLIKAFLLGNMNLEEQEESLFNSIIENI